jgi:hypothetical protein
MRAINAIVKDLIDYVEVKMTDRQVPLPKGHVEITDPNHVLRPGIDRYLSVWKIDSNGYLKWITAEQIDAENGPISTWLQCSDNYYRFCCPIEHYPRNEKQ